MTKIERVRQEVPPQLLTCAPEPAVPASDMEDVVALWTVDVLDAGADCRSKLDQVRKLVTAP